MWQFMLTYTTYHCFPNEKQLNSWLQPPNILKTTHTPQKICLPSRYSPQHFIVSSKYCKRHLCIPFLKTLSSDSPPLPGEGLQYGESIGFFSVLISPLKISFEYLFFLQNDYILFFSYVYDYFFLLVQLLVLQMQVLYEVSSLDFFLSQQFCLDDPAFSNRLKHHLCIASF